MTQQHFMDALTILLVCVFAHFIYAVAREAFRSSLGPVFPYDRDTIRAIKRNGK